jgi:periplasmic divalent cation tolerance protein
MPFIYITCKDKREAKRISEHLLIRKLVACTNMFPIESMYWWKGKIVSGKEYVVLAKTLQKNYNKIKKEVKKIHSYTIPCICLVKAISNEEYYNWLRKEIK